MNLFRRTAASLFFTTLVSPLACASAGATQDTARALLERAAYAEEHERNFAAAAELYARAAEMASKAGDAATEASAQSARAAVLARTGQAQRSDAKFSTSGASPQLMRLLAEGSQLAPATERSSMIFFPASESGASAVPWLEQMFSTRVPLATGDPATAWILNSPQVPSQILPNPKFAVYALARIDAPEATAALERCYASPDPLIRIAVVSSASANRHRALLQRALNDPAPSIAEMAVKQSRNVRDLALAEPMELAAKRGFKHAADWLCDNAPERALAFVEDRSTPLDLRVRATDQLGQGRLLAPSVDTARRLLQLGRESGEERLRATALLALGKHFGAARWQKAGGDLREPVGALVIAELERQPSVAFLKLLASIGPDATPQALLRAMKQLGTPLAPEIVAAVGECIDHAPFSTSAAAFGRWVEFLRQLPNLGLVESGPQPFSVQVVNRLASLAPSAPLDALIDGAHGLSGQSRIDYCGVLLRRLRTELQQDGRGPSAKSSAPLDPSVLKLALAVMAIFPKDGGKDVAACLTRLGDVERLPLAFDLYCNREISDSTDISPTIRQLIASNPRRGVALLEARLANLPMQESKVQQRLGKLGYASEDRQGIAQDDPAAVVRVIGFLPSDQALALFRAWYPKLASPDLRRVLHETLVGFIWGEEALAETVRLYPEFQEAITRKHAVDRFGSELVEDAVPLLGQALRDPDEYVRKAAQEASAAFKKQREALEEFTAWSNASQAQRESIAELVKLLESSNREVVLGAVRSLAAVRASTALPALVKLLERNDPELKKAVQDAISRVGEQ